jgi:hypothetical protein
MILGSMGSMLGLTYLLLQQVLYLHRKAQLPR